jgi:hypothetical protein
MCITVILFLIDQHHVWGLTPCDLKTFLGVLLFFFFFLLTAVVVTLLPASSNDAAAAGNLVSIVTIPLGVVWSFTPLHPTHAVYPRFFAAVNTAIVVAAPLDALVVKAAAPFFHLLPTPYSFAPLFSSCQVFGVIATLELVIVSLATVRVSTPIRIVVTTAVVVLAAIATAIVVSTTAIVAVTTIVTIVVVVVVAATAIVVVVVVVTTAVVAMPVFAIRIVVVVLAIVVAIFPLFLVVVVVVVIAVQVVVVLVL